jgi:hypothetical protein
MTLDRVQSQPPKSNVAPYDTGSYIAFPCSDHCTPMLPPPRGPKTESPAHPTLPLIHPTPSWISLNTSLASTPPCRNLGITGSGGSCFANKCFHCRSIYCQTNPQCFRSCPPSIYIITSTSQSTRHISHHKHHCCCKSNAFISISNARRNGIRHATPDIYPTHVIHPISSSNA